MRIAVAAVLILGLGVGCARKSTVQSAQSIFEAELRQRQVKFTGPDTEGLYTLHLGDGPKTISLDNVAKEYARDGAPEAVRSFAAVVSEPFEIPRWPRARSLIYFCAEPADNEFHDVVRVQVTKSVCKVLVLTDARESRLAWITPGHLRDWGVSQHDAMAAAMANMDRLLEGKQPDVGEPIDGMRLGVVPVDSVFKASTIFAPGFKRFTTQKLGWPTLAVVPCRDFIYIIAEKDRALLNRIGDVVQREFRNSAYPITTEVLRISDKGIEAIGKFPE